MISGALQKLKGTGFDKRYWKEIMKIITNLGRNRDWKGQFWHRILKIITNPDIHKVKKPPTHRPQVQRIAWSRPRQTSELRRVWNRLVLRNKQYYRVRHANELIAANFCKQTAQKLRLSHYFLNPTPWLNVPAKTKSKNQSEGES